MYWWCLKRVFHLQTFNRFSLVVYFLLGDSPESKFYVPTFRNTHFHLYRRCPYWKFSKTSAHKIQTPGNRPKERIQLLEHDKSLKSGLPLVGILKPRLGPGGISSKSNVAPYVWNKKTICVISCRHKGSRIFLLVFFDSLSSAPQTVIVFWFLKFWVTKFPSQWPCCLRRSSAVARCRDCGFESRWDYGSLLWLLCVR
jgi:hypothetical protein